MVIGSRLQSWLSHSCKVCLELWTLLPAMLVNLRIWVNLYCGKNAAKIIFTLTPRLRHLDTPMKLFSMELLFPSFLLTLLSEDLNTVADISTQNSPAWKKLKCKQLPQISQRTHTQHTGLHQTIKRSKIGTKLDRKLQCIKFSIPRHPTTSPRKLHLLPQTLFLSAFCFS